MKKTIIPILVTAITVAGGIWFLLSQKNEQPAIRGKEQIAYISDLDEKDPHFFRFLETNVNPVVYETHDITNNHNEIITTTNKIYEVNNVTNNFWNTTYTTNKIYEVNNVTNQIYEVTTNKIYEVNNVTNNFWNTTYTTNNIYEVNNVTNRFYEMTTITNTMENFVTNRIDIEDEKDPSVAITNETIYIKGKHITPITEIVEEDPNVSLENGIIIIKGASITPLKRDEAEINGNTITIKGRSIQAGIGGETDPTVSIQDNTITIKGNTITPITDEEDPVFQRWNQMITDDTSKPTAYMYGIPNGSSANWWNNKQPGGTTTTINPDNVSVIHLQTSGRTVSFYWQQMNGFHIKFANDLDEGQGWGVMTQFHFATIPEGYRPITWYGFTGLVKYRIGENGPTSFASCWMIIDGDGKCFVDVNTCPEWLNLQQPFSQSSNFIEGIYMSATYIFR